MIVLQQDDQCTIYKLTTAELELQLIGLIRRIESAPDFDHERWESDIRNYSSFNKGRSVSGLVWPDVISTCAGEIISDLANACAFPSAHPETTVYWLDYHVMPANLYNVDDILNIMLVD
jgi:hypothetical protein